MTRPSNGLVAGPQCPLPHQVTESILLGHGSGGTMTADLLNQYFLPAFANPQLDHMNDQAVLNIPEMPTARLAFTTDSFVVSPLFFPGGDIGCLAAHGTINDLVMGGAEPLGLSAAFILEEGFPLEDLRQITDSMAAACQRAGVNLVTGDTKVVERGKADGVYITTSGVGYVPSKVKISADQAQPGDVLLVSGPIGDHGIAVLSAREGLEFDTTVESDTAPLYGLVQAMLEVDAEIHCLRDPTRGGLATTLNEIANSSQVEMLIDEAAVPVRPSVQAACEMLGLDPFHVACEGRLIAVVDACNVDRLIDKMRAHTLGRDSAVIGKVVGEASEQSSRVVLQTVLGSQRIMQPLSGAQLPRIC